VKILSWPSRHIPIVKQGPRKLLWRGVIASTLLLVLGIGFSQIVNGHDKNGETLTPVLPFQDQQPVSTQPQTDAVHFHLILSGKLGTKGADSVDFGNYKADDGTLVQRRVETYHSPSQAQEKMQKMVEKAKRVVDRETTTDTHGKATGERVVLITESSDADVVWNENSSLFIIRSKKLEYALAFEKQMDQSHRK